tara:strand:+ start:905 stop:1078 length:174 start_codon:yes stop_codon:yes gene_type:complete
MSGFIAGTLTKKHLLLNAVILSGILCAIFAYFAVNKGQAKRYKELTEEEYEAWKKRR